MNNNFLNTFTKALNFAAFKHRNQRRKSGDIPYINHPIQVVNILASSGVTDMQVLSAAILHDTVEDTETTSEELQKQFGTKIRDIVLECTDDKTLIKVERKKLQIVKAQTATPQAKLVKIADKLSNCRDVKKNPPPFWTTERVYGYLVWAYCVCKNLKGVNHKLDQQIRNVFMDVGINDAINEIELHKKLQEYYATLGQIKK